MREAWRCSLALLAATLLGHKAYAHPSPQVLRIFWRDAAGTSLMLQTNRGLVFGDTANKQWRLLCPDVLQLSTSEIPDVASLPDGRLLLATSMGLWATRDDGCSWQAVGPAGDLLIPAMVLAPGSPGRLYITTFPRNSMAAGGMGQSAIRVSEDGAASWQVLLTVDDHDFVRSLQLAPSAPSHVYAAGTVYGQSDRTQYVAHSSDGGASWERFPLSVTQDEDYVRVLSVSPTDPLFVVAMVLAAEPSATAERLLLSHDAGKTFTSPLSTHWLTDASFSPEGDVIWVVSQDGLFRAQGAFEQFEHIGATSYMSCASEHAGELYVCGRYEGIEGAGAQFNGIATSQNAGQSFASLMNLTDIREPVTCGAGSDTDNACEVAWQHWQGEVLGIGSFALGGVDAGIAAIDGGAPTIDAGHAAGTAGDAHVATADGGSATGAAPTAAGDAAMPSARARAGGCGSCSLGARRRATPTADDAALCLLLLGLLLESRCRRYKHESAP